MARFDGLGGKALGMLFFLWFVWFMNFSVRTIFSPIMPLLEDEFAITHAGAGSLFGFMSLGYGLSLFLSGIFAGPVGYRKAVIASLSASAVIFFVIPFVRSFDVLCALSIVLGFSTGIYLPSILPLITDYYEERLWGKTIAIHDSAASLSIFAVPFIAVFMLDFMSWRTIFVVFGIVSALSVIFFAVASTEVTVGKKSSKEIMILLTEPNLWVMGIVWIFCAGACLGIYFVIPLYLTKELMIEMTKANEMFGLSRLGGIVVSIGAGFLVDRLSLKKTMFFLTLATGLLTMAVAVRDERIIGTTLFLQASITTGFFPLGLVAISRMFDRTQRSMATGFIVTLGVIFGLGVVPFLLGVAGDYASFQFGIMVFGVLVTLSSGLIWFLKELN